LLRFLSFVVNFTAPGAGLMMMGRWRFAVAIQLSLVSGTLVLCWSRFAFNPTIIRLFLIYVGSIILMSIGLCLTMKRPSSNRLVHDVIATITFIIIIWSAITFGFFYKDSLLGLHIYFVPSMSMYPTLKPGQFIVVDTWIYRNSYPKLGDVVIFKEKIDNRWFVKRITRWPNGEKMQNNKWFVMGDNRNFSIDSRNFGGVNRKQIVGQVSLVLLRIDQQHNIISDSLLKSVR
jgi:signal peptidase I